MKFIFLITFLFLSTSLSRTTVLEVELVRRNDQCKHFAEDLLSCKPNFCGLEMKTINDEPFSLNFKISGQKKKEACKVFFSDKDRNTVSVYEIQVNDKESKELGGYVSEIISKKNFKITSEDDCCAKDPTKKVHCDIKVDEKTFKNVADPSVYFDCFGRRTSMPLKKKTINYKK